MYLSRRSSASAPAFTLLELLVVISVIAVVIGLAIPAIRSVRQQAIATQCASHIQSCARTIALYTNDERETYPYRAQRPQFLQAFEFAGVQADFADQSPYWPGVCARYFDTLPRVAACPARQHALLPTPTPNTSGAYEVFSDYRLSYSMFSRPQLWDEANPILEASSLREVRVSDVLIPSRKAMLVEIFASHVGRINELGNGDDAYDLATDAGGRYPRPMAFADLSVRSLRRDDCTAPYAGTLGPGPWRRAPGLMTVQGVRGSDVQSAAAAIP